MHVSGHVHSNSFVKSHTQDSAPSLSSVYIFSDVPLNNNKNMGQNYFPMFLILANFSITKGPSGRASVLTGCVR